MALITLATAILFENSQVRMTLTEHLPKLLTIQALPSSTIEQTTVDSVLRETEKLLSNKTDFHTYWDLRDCPIPSTLIATNTLAWAWRHHNQLNTLNKRLAILMPASAVWLRLVNGVLRAFGPACPTFVTANETAALEFIQQASPTHFLETRARS